MDSITQEYNTRLVHVYLINNNKFSSFSTVDIQL